MIPGEADSLQREKQRLRREIRTAASSLTEEYRAEASRRITAQVLALEVYRKARVVMVFVSLPEEPDTREIIRDAVRAGKTVLLPRCVDKKRMVALPFAGWESLVPGWMDIPEPREPAEGTEVPDPELILAPCVTVSPDGRRLGHGAGYYDRFLAGREAKTVCLCYRQLTREDVPTGPLDRRMDQVITD